MKLAFIIPTIKTDDEESMREKLFYHIEYFLKDIDNLDWKLFFVLHRSIYKLYCGKCFYFGAIFFTSDDDYYIFLV